MSFDCAERSVHAFIGGLIYVFAIGCGSYRCEDCGPRKRAYLIRRALSGYPQRFVTLTTKPVEGEQWEDAVARTVRAYQHLVKRIRRRFGPNAWEAFAVLEQTEAQQPHLHILQRGSFVPQAWLSANWEELHGSKIVDIRAIENKRTVARYVGKYITKEVSRISKTRRYLATRNYVTQAGRVEFGLVKHEGRWRYSKTPAFIIVENLTAQGVIFEQQGPTAWVGVAARAPPLPEVTNKNKKDLAVEHAI